MHVRGEKAAGWREPNTERGYCGGIQRPQALRQCRAHSEGSGRAVNGTNGTANGTSERVERPERLNDLICYRVGMGIFSQT